MKKHELAKAINSSVPGKSVLAFATVAGSSLFTESSPYKTLNSKEYAGYVCKECGCEQHVTASASPNPHCFSCGSSELSRVQIASNGGGSTFTKFTADKELASVDCPSCKQVTVTHAKAVLAAKGHFHCVTCGTHLTVGSTALASLFNPEGEEMSKETAANSQGQDMLQDPHATADGKSISSEPGNRSEPGVMFPGTSLPGGADTNPFINNTDTNLEPVTASEDGEDDPMEIASDDDDPMEIASDDDDGDAEDEANEGEETAAADEEEETAATADDDFEFDPSVIGDGDDDEETADMLTDPAEDGASLFGEEGLGLPVTEEAAGDDMGGDFADEFTEIDSPDAALDMADSPAEADLFATDVAPPLADTLSMDDTADNLTVMSKAGQVIAMKGVYAVAVATASTVGKNKDLLGTPQFERALKITAKSQGMRRALASMGFKLLAGGKVTEVVADRARVTAKLELSNTISKERKAHADCLALAAVGLATNKWRGVLNPLRDAVVASLQDAGVSNANRVVANLFREHGLAYSKSMMEVAQKLSSQSAAMRKEYADMLDMVEDDADAAPEVTANADEMPIEDAGSMFGGDNMTEGDDEFGGEEEMNLQAVTSRLHRPAVTASSRGSNQKSSDDVVAAILRGNESWSFGN